MFYQRNLLNLAEYDFYKLVHIFLAFKHWERVSYIFNSERNWAQVESICRTLKTAAIQPIFWHMLTQRKLIIFKLFSQRKQCCCLIQKTVLFKIYLFGDLSLILKFSLIFSHWKCHIGKKKKKADQLLNTFYSFHLALSHLANYSYVIICIQLVVWLSQGSTACAVSARLSTLRFRVLDSGFIWAPSECRILDVQTSSYCWSANKSLYRKPDRSFGHKMLDVKISCPSSKKEEHKVCMLPSLHDKYNTWIYFNWCSS